MHEKAICNGTLGYVWIVEGKKVRGKKVMGKKVRRK